MNNNDMPKIIGFLCTWCSYTGADLAGTSRLRIPSSIRVIRTMCSGRIDPLFVLKCYLKEADGVMMMGCHPGNCHYQKGNYNARRRYVMLHNIFKTLGLEKDRIGLWWVSASEAPIYAKVTNEFTQQVKRLGPNPLREEIFI
ncbi:MAG: hydrogenase iron-sulfur subunit [Candidatus Aminicenantes bacterium]|nr:hydrogenase iron-sulfur subunit [Candidatus Aminicenantes bacterium]MDH5468884.1 hydrogenase iron-sulfur subunit [Candidatus Aminicenantes bacterium]